MNEAQPEYLSTLVVSFPAQGLIVTRQVSRGSSKHWTKPVPGNVLFQEMFWLLDSLELENTRSFVERSRLQLPGA